MVTHHLRSVYWREDVSSVPPANLKQSSAPTDVEQYNLYRKEKICVIYSSSCVIRTHPRSPRTKAQLFVNCSESVQYNPLPLLLHCMPTNTTSVVSACLHLPKTIFSSPTHSPSPPLPPISNPPVLTPVTFAVLNCLDSAASSSWGGGVRVSNNSMAFVQTRYLSHWIGTLALDRVAVLLS